MVLIVSAVVRAEDRLWLIRDGRACCTIVRGPNDDYAAERLQTWLAEQTGAKVPIRRDGDRAGSRQLHTIVLASPPAKTGLEVDLSGLTEQGYVTKTSHGRGGAGGVVTVAGGGRDGVIHAVADLMNEYLNVEGKGVWVRPLDTRQVPRFKYRWFWTWDHRMDWGGPGKPGSVMGGGGTFAKKPEAFLIDHKRCVDFMADHKFNGLIIWGFLRDTHGGIEATQELCRYAKHRGVRILPGVGTSGYAGYYFEGDHPFNADAWLKKHPELRSIRKDGKPRNAPCPSKKANQDWLDRGARWLFENFEIGGVNLEMGDFFVCYCDDCKRARATIDSNEPDYYKDMAISHRVTLETMRKLAPEAWLSYATYTGYTAEMMKTPPKFLSMIPDDALCQWTLSSMARNWPADVKPMARHNVGYLHWCNSSTHTQDDFYLERVRRICRDAAGAGFEGLDTYGELPDTKPNAELFYLAWEGFLWDPDMTVEQFVDRRLARVYGGKQPARTLLKIIPLIRTRRDRTDPDRCGRARELAAAARAASLPVGHERWDRLIACIEGHERTAREVIEQRRRREAAARAGRKVPVRAVRASDEETGKKSWPASKAIDGSVDEPTGYWLTRYVHPKRAWIELTLAQPSKVNRVVLFHQLNAAHYRSRDYTVNVRAGGKWRQVVSVKDNDAAGWVAHAFGPVTTDAVRLEITRSAYGNRMGVGEIEVRCVE